MTSPRINLFNMNLLRVFDALYRERNATRAGRRLGISQSAVSHSLSQMRAFLGDELFIRTGSTMLPTDRAIELGGTIGQIIQQVEAMISQEEFVPETSTRAFAIAAGDYSTSVLMPTVVRMLRAAAPNVSLRMVSLSEDSMRWLHDGDLDIVLSFFSSLPPGMRSDRLLEDDIIWVARGGHPLPENSPCEEYLSRHGSVTVDITAPSEALGTTPAHSFAGGMTLFTSTGALLRSSGDRIDLPSLPCTVAASSYRSALNIVLKTDMIAAVPSRMISPAYSPASFRVLSTDRMAPQSVLSAVWREDYGEQSAMRWLRALLAQACADIVRSEKLEPRQGGPAGSRGMAWPD